MVYQILDWAFMVFHISLIAFNLFGWIWKTTRKANLITLGLTAFSWVGLGFFYGIGYCPLTDWHWIVLEKLGSAPSTNSYIVYLFQRVLGLSISSSLADNITISAFIAALILSIITNTAEFIKRRKKLGF
jgi:hypothetical protein